MRIRPLVVVGRLKYMILFCFCIFSLIKILQIFLAHCKDNAIALKGL